ncbi:MAG: hypothetical protein GY926_27285 [bacterium]|nr:hypothetical protein [bacterium]
MLKRLWTIGLAVAAFGFVGCGSVHVPVALPPIGCPDSMLTTTTVPTEEFHTDFVDMVSLPLDWKEGGAPKGGLLRDYHAPQMLSVRFVDDTVDPDARIIELAEKHRGAAVGIDSAPGSKQYTVRFCGYGLADLIELGSILEKEPDVDHAGPYVRMLETPDYPEG